MDEDSIKLDLLKIKLKDLISKKIGDVLIKKELSLKQIQEMAVDVTETLKDIKTKQEFIALVDALDKAYPFLKSEAAFMRAELGEVREQMVIGKLENYFKSLSIHK